MIDKLKQEAMKRGMTLLTNPKVMKFMSDPRVMKTISQGFALRGRVQSEVDDRLRTLADTFNLATREEVRDLKRAIGRMERDMTDMDRRLKDNPSD